MSRSKPSTDTPPPGGSNLTQDFQSFCSPPALTGPLKDSPLASQLTQQLAPSPTSVSPVPQSDYFNNIQCLSNQLSKPFHDMALVFPGTQSTWELCSLSSKLPGYLDPASFQSWVAPPPITAPLSDSQLAALLFQLFRDKYPWSVLLEGTQTTGPSYDSHLPLR